MTLEQFRLWPASFNGAAGRTQTSSRIDPEGAPRYLTSVISSSLSWLPDDDARELVWDAAGARLAERSGRNAVPSMTRSFQINDGLTVTLFEPSLTEDNLGLKTWISSFLLAKRLSQLRKYLPENCSRVLELGAGTGLVGIAAARTWDVGVVLTDLPPIIPNLQKNVDQNKHGRPEQCPKTTVRALDWSDITNVPATREDTFAVILAADAVYSVEHPRLLSDTVQRWLAKTEDACFIVELPLREGYDYERQEMRCRLQGQGLHLVDEGTETGYDDWQGHDENPIGVVCWWSVWRRSSLAPSAD